jgi:hypothetical protein
MALLSKLLAQSSGRIVCWGYGHTFEFFQKIVLEQHKLNASVIIDKKFIKVVYENGVEMIPPRSVDSRVSRDDLIIITIGSRAVAYDIECRLKSFGFYNVFNFQEIYDYNLVYWPKQKGSYVQNAFSRKKTEISTARKMFTDAESVNLFDSIIRTHLEQSLNKITPLPIELQYYLPDFLPIHTYSDLFQVGAFDGDTLRNFECLGIVPQKVTALEPDQRNFEKLSNNLPKSWGNT